MDKETLIKKIKSFEEPPWDKNDIYYTRYPWNLLGGVGTGICECWMWFSKDIISEKCTYETLQYALKLLEEG